MLKINLFNCKTIWDKIKTIHNYCYLNNQDLKRKDLMNLIYPNQTIYNATTVDVYRALISKANYSKIKSTGVYTVFYFIPTELSISDIKKEIKTLNK